MEIYFAIILPLPLEATATAVLQVTWSYVKTWFDLNKTCVSNHNCTETFQTTRNPKVAIRGVVRMETAFSRNTTSWLVLVGYKQDLTIAIVCCWNQLQPVIVMKIYCKHVTFLLESRPSSVWAGKIIYIFLMSENAKQMVAPLIS